MTKQQEKDIIELLLGIKKEPNRKSCLLMAYNSAKALSTGACIEEFGDIESEHFSSIILCLIFWEQVGTIFKKASENSIEIMRALEDFSTITIEDDRRAIYYLRNTLAHNYGLATENIAQKHYKYTLTLSGDVVVKHANPSWNNDFADKRDCTSTKINIIQLMTVMDNVFERLKVEYESNSLQLRIKDKDEILTRFTVLIE